MRYNRTDPRLRKKIVEFLVALPPMHSENSRKALLLGTGLGEIALSLELSGSTKDFVPRLIEALEQYGVLPNQQSALICFLQEVKTYVGVDRQEELEEFCQRLSASPERLVETCPYRGLSPFREEDELFFFGRETYIQKLVETVQHKSLIAVIGASGSGKSSVVYAGLIPELRRQKILSGEAREARTWLITSFRPGNDPFKALAKELIPFLYPDELDRLSHTEKLAKQLRSSEIPLNDVIERILDKEKKAEKCLLFADQFEELYTLCRDDDARRRFLDELLGMLDGQTLVCILTMRADFLNKALSYRPFADAFQDSDIVLGPMNQEELRDAIEKPANALHVEIEDGLTERILRMVIDTPGSLPFLEFALTELWKKQTNGTLTHVAYNEIGGVEKALTYHADREFEKLTERERERARQIFLQLVLPGEGTEDIRRVATVTEIGEKNWDIVKKLADARLVVTGGSEKIDEEVEVVHEALITGWQQLREWMDADREFRMWQERLRAAMRQWHTSHRDEGALLRGVPLAEAESWLQKRQIELSPDEQVYIQTSLALKGREQNRQRKLALFRRMTLSVIGILIIIALSIGWWSARRIAKQAQKFAKEQNNLILTAHALRELDRSPDLALALALEAYHTAPSSQTRNIILPEDVFADTGYYRPGTRRRFAGHTKTVKSVAFHPDGKSVLSGSEDSTLRLWDIETGKEVRRFTGHTESVNSVAVSPDGRFALSGSSDKSLRLWDIETGKELRRFIGHTKTVNSIVFSPDGHQVLSGSDDQSVRLWDITTGEELQQFSEHTSQVRSVIFSPDGQTIVSGSYYAGQICWWKTDTGEKIYCQELDYIVGATHGVHNLAFSPDHQEILVGLGGYPGGVNIILWDLPNKRFLQTFKGFASGASVAFTPDGRTILSGSYDNKLRLWQNWIGVPSHRQFTGDEILQFAGHTGKVMSIALSPDGRTALSGSADQTLRLWELCSRAEFRRGEYGNGVFRPPNGRTVLLVGKDERSLKLWDIETGKELRQFIGHTYSITSVAFSSDGHRAISGSLDNSLILWDIETGEKLQQFTGHAARVVFVAYSPTGRTVLSGSYYDKTLRLWDVMTGKELWQITEGVRSAAFSPDGEMILSGGNDHHLHLRDSITGKEIRIFSGHTGIVHGVAFSPDGKNALSGSEDLSIRLWDISTGKELRRFTGHTETINSVAFSPDGKTFLSASNDQQIILWDIETGQEIVHLLGHSKGIRSVTFSPDGHMALSSAWDGTTRLWRLDPPEDLITWIEQNRYVRELTSDERKKYRVQP